ncbi:MAG TPA: EAL domain-containing protein [Jatrophihabitans sp.]|nr:EAL domain-containing protein [Jatrophihabitans sp.]
MRKAWVARLSRILIAGDGTLLVADRSLTDPLPIDEVLAEDHPLRIAAEAMLAGSTSMPADIRVRQLRTPRGQLAAAELQRGSVVQPLLPLRDWVYPGADPARPALDPGADPIGLGLSLLLPDVPAFQSGIRELFSSGRVLRELRLVERSGTGEPASETIHTVRLYAWRPDPAPGTTPIGVSVDITGLTGVPEDSGPFLDALLSVGPDSVLVLDVQREELLWSNRRLASALGYRPEQLGRFADIRAAIQSSDRVRLDALIEQVGAGLDATVHDMQLRIRDVTGRWRWMQLWLTPWLSSGGDGPVVEQLVCTLRDVDESVRAEQRLHWESRHDPLTGLANRRAMHELLERLSDDLADPRRYVYFLDLDDFRRVNDALGHSAGDELLRTLAARISVLVHASDLVARFGGDELVIVSRMEPALLAPKMLTAVQARTMLAGSEVTVSASVGAAVLGVAELAGDVIRRANDAMYQAKLAGGNTYRLAGPLDSARAQQRVELEADLRRALSENSPDLYVAYQPMVDRSLHPIAAEALLRWDHPRRGVLLPDQFLDVADAAGLMAELGSLILARAVRQAAEWRAAGHPLAVTVNVAARQLGSGVLEQLVISLLDETKLPPALVCLEVTESVLVDGDSPELAELIRLRELGVRIALDDFGTGYSPLTYLKRIPATVLKLDKSFVTGLNAIRPHPADLAIAKMVQQLASELGMQAVAEGVENSAQFDALIELGYEVFQGFWAYSPMPANQLGAVLARPRVVRDPMA